MTLEQGGRYFKMEGQETDSSVGGFSLGTVWSRPSGDAIFTIMRDGDDTTGAYDAVYIIMETDDQAGGGMSDLARSAFDAYVLADGIDYQYNTTSTHYGVDTL